jgi:tetratricopeptide (TPR) repeat protein
VAARRGNETLDRWLAIGLSLAAGAGLLYLGVPRLMAAIANLPGDRVYTEIQDGFTPRRDSFDTLLKARLEAAEWVESGRDWTDIGAAYLLIARHDRAAGDADKAELAKAIAAVRKGLEIAPANPFAWARLALVQYMHDGGPTPAMAESLKMSLLTGSFDERLVLTRLDLCFRAFAYFQGDDRDLIRQQVQYAWGISPPQVVEMGRNPLRRGFIAASLATLPEALASFEREVMRRSN